MNYRLIIAKWLSGQMFFVFPDPVLEDALIHATKTVRLRLVASGLPEDHDRLIIQVLVIRDAVHLPCVHNLQLQ